MKPRLAAALAACFGVSCAASPGASLAADCGLPDFQRDLTARVNQWRAQGASCGDHGRFRAAPPVTWNEPLSKAAEAHSRDMASRNFFSHAGSSGSKLPQRVERAGYLWRGVGENIAGGSTTVAAVVDGWIKSPGHCANIMNPGFVHMGVACVPGGQRNTYKTYWTMDFGTPR